MLGPDGGDALGMAPWQLLILMCFGMPVGTSLAAAEHARDGLVGYALAICVGPIVGGVLRIGNVASQIELLPQGPGTS